MFSHLLAGGKIPKRVQQKMLEDAIVCEAVGLTQIDVDCYVPRKFLSLSISLSLCSVFCIGKEINIVNRGRESMMSCLRVQPTSAGDLAIAGSEGN